MAFYPSCYGPITEENERIIDARYQENKRRSEDEWLARIIRDYGSLDAFAKAQKEKEKQERFRFRNCAQF